METERSINHFWSDNNEDSDKARSILTKNSVAFREFSSAKYNFDLESGNKLPILFTELGSFNGECEIESIAKLLNWDLHQD